MQVVLLRVGIDKGSGGIYGPIFQDDSFEFICIPDKRNIDERTYGTIIGKYGKPLIDYFPESSRHKMENQPVHVDPEFTTFTYGDLVPLKSRLGQLEPGDLIAFYCGLKGWNCETEAALYLVGYFEVQRAVKAIDYSRQDLRPMFGDNFHVHHERVYNAQREKLVLVKGTDNSRLLKKARLISEVGHDKRWRRIHVLSKEMRERFGDFDGRVCIQRCPPRWVSPKYVEQAAQFIRSLE